MCMYQLSKALCSVTCASKIYVVMALMDATLLKTSNIYNHVKVKYTRFRSAGTYKSRLILMHRRA